MSESTEKLKKEKYWLAIFVPEDWPVPTSNDDLLVAADYWDEQGDAQRAKLCRYVEKLTDDLQINASLELLGLPRYESTPQLHTTPVQFDRSYDASTRDVKFRAWLDYRPITYSPRHFAKIGHYS